MKSIVTDGYGCPIIYYVKPKVKIILENMTDPDAQKIPKIFENYNSKCLKYLKEPSERVLMDEKKEDAIIRSVFEEVNKCLNKFQNSYEINKPRLAFNPGNNKTSWCNRNHWRKGFKSVQIID